MNMPMWHTKAEIHLLTLLQDKENVLHSGRGSLNKKEALIALTDRRVIIIRMGAFKWSEPEVHEIRLSHIMTAEVESRCMLLIHSRTGMFHIALQIGQSRFDAPKWPNWILQAQESMV